MPFAIKHVIINWFVVVFCLIQNEASRLNHQQVVEEHRKSQLPNNWEKKKEWVEWKLNEEEKRVKADEDGIEYDRVKLLDVQADEAERWQRKKDSKKHADPGFSGYDAATARWVTFDHSSSLIITYN